MRSSNIQLPQLFRDSTENVTLVAATSRLAREFRYSFDYEQRQTGAKVWARPRIQTFTQWTLTAYADLGERHPDLAARSVVSDDTLQVIAQQRAPNLDVEMHSRAITEAWQLVWDANLWADFKDIRTTENGKLCDDWFNRIRRFLDAQKLITIAELPATLQRAVERADWRPPPIMTAGFDEISVSQRNLFKSLEALGLCSDAPLDKADDEPSSIRLEQFDDESKEFAALAMWAREKLKAYGHTASIGICVHNLAGSQRALQRCFESVFPEVEDIASLISLDYGHPFTEHRLCNDFLSLLRWTCAPLPHSALLSLARSPYFPQLNLFRQPQSWFDERMSIRGYRNRIAKDERRAIDEVIRLTPRQNRRDMSFVEATAKLTGIIRACGYAQQTTDSLDYVDSKAVRTLNDLVQRIEQTASILPRITWSRFVERVELLANDSAIDASQADAPIQIMGRNATAHLRFDALWVNGISDADLPAVPNPNPFVPRLMLKRARLPRVTHEQMLIEAQALTQHWAHGASEVVFSFANSTDTVEAQPSNLITSALAERDTDPAIATAPLIENEELIANGHPWSTRLVPNAVREYQQTNAAPIALGDVKARTSLLRDQLCCPFRGWAVHEAGIRESGDPRPRFPDALVRGTVFHEVVGKLLTTANTQEELAKLSDAEVAQIVDETLDEVPETKGLPARFKKTERARLLKGISNWIEFEVTMRDAFSVLAVEKEIQVEISGLTFNARIDRIDRTDSLDLLVVDHKTSSNYHVKSWNPTELSDSQMPLYAIGIPACDGVAYITTFRDRNGSMKTQFAGIVDTEEEPEAKGLAIRLGDQDLPALKTSWSRKLEEAVQDHLEGHAEVKPVNDEVCRYCHLSNACRIYERPAS